ncbi:MAG: DUF4388 domain-containing protein [Pseudomonadota bacterium]
MTQERAVQDQTSFDLTIPRAVAQRLQLEDSHLMLRHRVGEQPRVLLGDLTFTSVPEVLTIVNAGKRTGELVLQFDVARKTLSFVDGEVVAVQTNVPDDRLGEVMWRQGIITLDQLMIATDQLSTGKRLGRLLIDSGFIGTPQLYQGLRAQVREVLLSVFHFRGGMFCFVGHMPQLMTPLSLEESTESLILAGVHQLDELNRMRRQVGSLDAEVAAVSPQPKGKLRDIEEAVIQLLASARKPLTIRVVLERCHLGEFQGLKAVVELLRLQRIERSRVPEPSSARTARTDNIQLAVNVINTLTRVLHDECQGADQWVRLYLDDLEIAGQPMFRLQPPADRCQLDATALRERAQALAPTAVDELAGVLRDAIDFAMFQVSETLDTDRAGEIFLEVSPLLTGARAR